MQLATALSTAVLVFVAQGAFAQGTVYRCLDDNGRPQYTNVKTDTDGKKCTVVTREVSVVTPPSAPAAAPRPATPPQTANPGPAGFPKVDQQTQRSRDESRRKILEDELAAERRSLDKAKSDLAQQESERSGNERNYARVLERLKPFQDAVERHERNIGALQKELSNIR
jgi:septal ring factor EnvC (AmiA/AmiB activator)